MGEDLRDVYDFLRKEGKKRRERNKDGSTQLLRNNEIPFEVKRNGYHLIIDGWADFWPSTGLYIIRVTHKRGRGVKNLIKEYLNGRS